MTDRRIFIAGSTGATGRTIVRLAGDAPDLVLHLRPKSASKQSSLDPRAAVFALDDEAKLQETLQGCTTVVQLIGTMRKRFGLGDTYETSDIGTTRLLMDAAKASSIDHAVLLSSVGAGRPMGAYLEAKAKAEQIVRDSGIAYTILRPSAFEGEGHRPPPGMGLLTRALRLDRYRPIPIEDLARIILRVAREREPLNTILEGTALLEAARHR